MKITIDEGICEKKGLNLDTLLAILLVKGGTNIKELFDSLTEKKVLVINNNISGSYLVNKKWSDLATEVLLVSDSSIPTEDSIYNLAGELMKIFPKGKKEGTSCYWRGNRNDIKSKLQKFYKLYGDKYTDEQIISATKKYVASFNGNYNYMRILKYFIWKAEKKMNEEGKIYVEEVSNLADFIENEGQDNLNTEWTATLV